ncbi:MAG: phage shock protein operon transcriptional activator [Desulfatiglandaceae bacterium]
MKEKKNISARGAKSAVTVGIEDALGSSDVFLEFQEMLSRAARVDRPVLLIGERGTGKEIAASRLHYLSRRWRSPLIALNCSALSSSLIESELFGYEKGAFTGAEQRRVGRFEAAEGGTIFLDEIGLLPMEVQEKILRVVEYGTFERVGSPERMEVDVRIVAATNTDLLVLADEGRFKRDLLDRLSFEVLYLPPLRKRKGDVPLLAHHFAGRMALELGWQDVPQFSPEAMAKLESYNWPGNIRELKNAVERAVYRSDATLIKTIVFQPFKPSPELHAPKETIDEKSESKGLETDEILKMPFKEAMRRVELLLLKKALRESRFNQRKAAGAMGLTYHQLRGLYRKYKGELNA